MLKSRGRVVAIVGVVMVVVAAGAAAFYFGKSSAAASAPPHEPEPVRPGPQYVLKERIINLADPGARRYLKIAMAIEMGGAKENDEFAKAAGEERQRKQAEFEKSLAPWAPLIDDAVLTEASSRTSEELSTPEGKARLKDAIIQSVNRILGSEMATNVFFIQFVMQ